MLLLQRREDGTDFVVKNIDPGVSSSSFPFFYNGLPVTVMFVRVCNQLPPSIVFVIGLCGSLTLTPWFPTHVHWSDARVRFLLKLFPLFLHGEAPTAAHLVLALPSPASWRFRPPAPGWPVPGGQRPLGAVPRCLPQQEPTVLAFLFIIGTLASIATMVSIVVWRAYWT